MCCADVQLTVSVCDATRTNSLQYSLLSTNPNPNPRPTRYLCCQLRVHSMSIVPAMYISEMSLDVPCPPHCLFQASFFPGKGAINPPKKLTTPPQTAAKLCALNLFSAGEIIINISLKLSFNRNKHRKLFVIKQSKGCKLMQQSRLRLAVVLRCLCSSMRATVYWPECRKGIGAQSQSKVHE